MKAAAPLQLREAGQSLWLDNITRDLLMSGTLKRYIDELSITGLTSNPTIFDHAITKSQAYDAAIRQKIRQVKSDEELFFDLAIEDLTQAADLFRPIYDATDGVDGWVSLEVSPLLAYDTASTIAQAKELHARAGRPNLFIKIPGTKEGLPAIEEAIFAGVPINVTLLFSHEQYLAAVRDAALDVGVALSENLTGGVYVNQSAAFSDFHATGANPAANASYTDGDLDYNGKVDFFDIVLLLSANYNTGQTFGPAAAGRSAIRAV